jgi:hypothetical protein
MKTIFILMFIITIITFLLYVLSPFVKFRRKGRTNYIVSMFILTVIQLGITIIFSILCLIKYF